MSKTTPEPADRSTVPPPEALTKAGLADHLLSRLGLSKRESQEIVEAFFKLMHDRLAEGEDVKLQGFGNFSVRQRPARPGRNVRTGDVVLIEARRAVTFQASRLLKEMVQTRLLPAADGQARDMSDSESSEPSVT
jgi:integration host factor subunit alpha